MKGGWNLGGTNLNLVSAPKEHAGIAFAISNVFYLTGCALGPTLAAAFMESHLVAASGLGARFPSIESYHLIFAAGIGVSIVVMAASIWASKMGNRQVAS